MKRASWILLGALAAWLAAPALPSAAPLVQAVLLNVGAATAPTALTATGTSLNVNCQ